MFRRLSSGMNIELLSPATDIVWSGFTTMNGRGEGFWYQGRRVTDAVMFYNKSDELVSIGFMHNGGFIYIRDDNRGYKNDDSFFFSWWSR